MRLALELALARSAGRLSRLAGRGGGTTIPGKILATIDPGSVSTLAARLPRGTAAISATNGKTTTAALVAAIVGKSIRLAHNGSGANLVSGVASTLIEARDAELGLFEVDEGAFPEVARRIRQEHPTKPLLIALSGYGREEDKQQSKAAGFDHHLVKPVDPNRLASLIGQRAAVESQRAR